MQTGAAYIRVSTEEQVEFSPDSQLKKIREYAQSHSIRLPAEFIFLDEGISGRHAEKRPSFMRMIAAAKSRPKPFDVILLWKFSRFARNRQDSILYKSMLRKECGVEVISITEQLSDDPTSILIEALLEAMDEYYSINLAQEVRRGMNEKFSRGGVVSRPPLGYRMEAGRFQPDPVAAPLVRMIFADFLAGASCRGIAAKLNTLGARTAQGNLFEVRTVEYILSNPTYLGKLRRSLDGPDASDRFHRGENVVLVDAPHPPLVEVELYQAAQERLALLGRSRSGHSRETPAGFMLRGLVRCSCCGGTLTRTAGGSALQCHRYGRGQCPESHYIILERLNRAVLAKLASDLSGSELRLSPPGTHPTEDEANAARALLEREQRHLERSRAAYEDGTDTLDEYRLRKEKLLARIRLLEERLKTAKAPANPAAPAKNVRIEDVLVCMASTEISEEVKNIFLRALVTKIVLYRAEGTLEITYHL